MCLTEKQQYLLEKVKELQSLGFTGNLQINFSQGKIGNRINLSNSDYLIDKEQDTM